MQEYKRNNGGYVVILNTLVFLIVSFFVVYAIAAPLLSNNSSSATLLSSKKAFVVANSAIEDTLYRMKNQMNVGSSETLTLASTTATITISNTYSGKIITVESSDEDVERNIRATVSEGVGASFNYGMQAGRGGFQMTGDSGILGNVYSNGDIIGDGGPYITGSATVANGSDPVAEQSNGDGEPSHDASFGGGIEGEGQKPEDIAQSFIVETDTPITSVRLYIKKYADVPMNNAIVRITNDAADHPGKTTFALGSLSANHVTTSYNYITIPFSSTPNLNPGTTYWLVIDASNSLDSYYMLGANEDGYPNGELKLGKWAKNNGGAWDETTPSNLDGFFDIYVGGETGSITGVTVGESGEGDVWAHEANDLTVEGELYCQSSSNTNKPCDTSRPDPVQQPYPISEGNIQTWKDEGTAGGTTEGDVSYGNQDVVSLGPQKINGDLTVGAGATLNITGTLYVTGDVSVTAGGEIKLSSAYGNSSGVIVTDGKVSAGGQGEFKGNGFPDSYILVVTTSTCPIGCSGDPAINITGGTGSVIMNAQQGTIEFSGGAQAKQATAETISMVGGTTVSYETGLADITFSSGPSGSWNVLEWGEY